MKRHSKLIAIMTVFVFLFTVFAPMATTPAEAASTNRVDRVMHVQDNHPFVIGNVPVLSIEESRNNEFGTAERFRLRLTNAKFRTTDAAAIESVSSVYRASRLSDSLMEITLADLPTTGSAKRIWNLPLMSEVTAKGEVTVTIEPFDSRVSGGTYTYAISASGGSVATIGEVKNFANSVTLGGIVIDETRLGSLAGNHEIKLRLPSGFRFVSGNVNITGGLSGTHSALSFGDRDLNFRVNLTSTGTRGSVVLENVVINATSSARFGDVVMSIKGGEVSEQELLVAKYLDYGVTVKADGDPLELIAGRWDAAAAYNDQFTSGDVHRLQRLVIEETADGAWLAQRRTRVEFPRGVKIIGVTQHSKTENVPAGAFTFPASEKLNGDVFGKNYIEFQNISLQSGKSKAVLTFFVSVEADFTGDITATVTGNAIGNEKFDVVLGKAVAPVTAKVESADLRIGRLGQPIGKITITETQREAIIQDRNLVITLGRNNDGINWAAVPTIEVVEGDLELDLKAARRDTTNLNQLVIPVKTDSTRPSTIVISNGRADVNRMVAEGQFSVDIGGSAIVENNNRDKQDEGRFDKGNVVSVRALNVVTPAPGETRATSVFTLGSTTYKVVEAGVSVERTMDAAPFAKDGRTFLPVRFVAYALGVSSDNIVWNPVTKTVTVFKGDRIAQMTLGSKILTVNGTPVMMDTAPEAVDGRVFLPVRFMAQALGASIEWDQATQSVTITQ